MLETISAHVFDTDVSQFTAADCIDTPLTRTVVPVVNWVKPCTNPKVKDNTPIITFPAAVTCTAEPFGVAPAEVVPEMTKVFPVATAEKPLTPELAFILVATKAAVFGLEVVQFIEAVSNWVPPTFTEVILFVPGFDDPA